MANFAITYDLIRKKDYPELWNELERLGAHKALNSFYLVNLDNTAQEVKDHLAEYIDDDDRLMVAQITGKPKFTKALSGTNKWIEANC